MNSTKVITIGFFLMMLLLTGCSSELGSIEKIFDKDGADGDAVSGGQDDDQIEAEVVVIDSEINLKEIAEHGVKGDCWTGVDGMVYDLTAYIALGEHDSKIEMACGVDATEMMTKHKNSDKTQIVLDDYYIGKIK